MIRRLYVHNFRCLENFELNLIDRRSVLLIGQNGAGKSTVRRSLEILQAVARGNVQVAALIKPADFNKANNSSSMMFQLEVKVGSRAFTYSLALQLLEDSQATIVQQESLTVDGAPVFTRDGEVLELHPTVNKVPGKIEFAPTVFALPSMHGDSISSPIFRFKDWLSRVILAAPITRLIEGATIGANLTPNSDMIDLPGFLQGVLSSSPAAYRDIEDYLQEVMPDFIAIKSELTRTRSFYRIAFESKGRSLELPLDALSDGEKCYLISSLIIAYQASFSGLTCFWDEPDSHIALPEIQHLIMRHRKVGNGAQFIATSHNPQVIQAFPRDDTLLIYRENHVSPPRVKPLSEIELNGDLIDALVLSNEQPYDWQIAG